MAKPQGLSIWIAADLTPPDIKWRRADDPPPATGPDKLCSDVVLALLGDGNNHTVSVETVFHQHEYCRSSQRTPGWWFDGIPSADGGDAGLIPKGEVLAWAPQTYGIDGRES